MPDYAGCTTKECEKKSKCARYLMVFDDIQTILEIRNWKQCDSFWATGSPSRPVPFKIDYRKGDT